MIRSTLAACLCYCGLALVQTSRIAQRQRLVRLLAEPVQGKGISVPRNVMGGDLQCCCGAFTR